MKKIPNCSSDFGTSKRLLQGRKNTTLNNSQKVNYQQLTHPLFNSTEVRKALATKGYARFNTEVALDLKSELAKLAASFEDLPLDKNDERKTRRRAYQKFVEHGWDFALTVRPVSTYYQEMEFNPIDGGTPREFASLGAIAENVFLLAYIQNLFAAIPLTMESRLSVWDVGVHLIRMEARAGVPALASPPWPHKDGEPITAIGVIARENIKGGRTIVCEDLTAEKAPKGVLEDCILEPLETAVVVDSKVYHHVTDVEVADGVAIGHRDVVLVEFTPFKQDFRSLVLAKS